MLSECFSGRKQHFNLFLNFSKEVPCYMRNPKPCFSSPNKIYSSTNKTKIAPEIFSYELTCNLFLPVFWALSLLAAGVQRQRAHFETIICFLVLQVWRVTTFTLGCYIFPLYLFSIQLGFLQNTELSFSSPFIEGHIYIFIQEGCHLERVEVLGARL